MVVIIREKAKRGFTLVETLVAITILLVAIAGPLTLATKSLFAGLVARDQLTAAFLAQDAIEFLRFTRDTNFINNTPWLNGNISACQTPYGCRVDSAADNIAACGASGCAPLEYKESMGLYGYNMSGSETTSFVRRIVMAPVSGNPDEYTIEVQVTWQTGPFTRTFTTKEHIYNWLK